MQTMEGMLRGENWIIDILDIYHNYHQLVSHPKLQFIKENKSKAKTAFSVYGLSA